MHSFLPPSGAHIWSKCAMFPTMNARFGDEAGIEADEGTAAHWVAWEIFHNHPVFPNVSAPNGVIVTNEMIEGGELLVDTIRSIHDSGTWIIEQTIPIASIHPQCYGTPDAWNCNAIARKIHIIDYKFGHRFVDEYFNDQLLCYLSGIVDILTRELKIGPGLMDQYPWKVCFTVVQPRCFYRGEPVRTHTFNLVDARPHFNRLANMAEASTMDSPQAVTNSECGDCPGRHACDALQRAAYRDAEFASRAIPLVIEPLPAALELRMMERALKRLEARVEGLKQLTISNLKAGAQIPYYHLESGRGRTQWNVPPSQVVEVGKLYGVNLAKEDTVTPTQAKKLGLADFLVDAFSTTPIAAAKLVPDNPNDAAKIFGKD